MKKLRTFFLSLTVSSLLLCSYPAFSSAEVNQKATLEEKFNFLKENGILVGDQEGNPRYHDEMTRAELAVVLTRVFDLPMIEQPPRFTDTEHHWGSQFIEAVYEAGFMQGMGNKVFSPDGKVTAEQFITTLVKSYNIKPNEEALEAYNELFGETAKVSDWAKPYIGGALKESIILYANDYTVPAKRSYLIDVLSMVYSYYNLQGNKVKYPDEPISSASTDELPSFTLTFPEDHRYPFELFDPTNPWRVSLNLEEYQQPQRSKVKIALTRIKDGKSWSFDKNNEQGTFSITSQTIIFQPMDIPVYEKGDIFEVEISGIHDLKGTPSSIRYIVEWISPITP